MDLDAVAEELYALPREEFTAARDARAKEARGAGRRDLADALKKLAKPTAAAWLANRLAREHPDEVRSLLDLGDALRAATAARDGTELRRLAPRQHELLRALADRAHRLAEAAGQRVTDDTARGLDDTLRAAVADPALGEQLAAGRLTDVLQHAGFPTLGFGPAPPAPAPPRTEPLPADTSPAAPSKEPSKEPPREPPTEDPAATRRRAARLGEAEKELADVRSRADAAESARAEAEREVADAGDEAAQVGERIRRLRDELSRAEAEQKRVGQREARARRSLERAETAAAAAAARQARAAAALDRLADG